MAHAPLDQGGDVLGLLQGDVESGLADHGAVREHLAVAVGQGDGLAAVVEGGDRGESGAEVDADELARHCSPRRFEISDFRFQISDFRLPGFTVRPYKNNSTA